MANITSATLALLIILLGMLVNLDGSDLSTSVTLGVNKSAAFTSINSNKKKFRVYKVSPPIKKEK